ncbi:MAG: hypothetical protein JW787_01700 [Sedimentisphaerales bacterium]|nr:hypothetical protein [Sedimentisphaerales bacterium]
MTKANNSRFSRVIISAITICIISIPAYSKYSGGTGEPKNPYKIATAADLIALGESSEDYKKHFILTSDIDLAPNLPGGRVFNKAVIAPDTDPDDYRNDFQGSPFAGIFDGNGHTISNLTITNGSYTGLFGQLMSGAMIKNLGLVDINITNSDSYVGSLAGCNYGTVFQCCSTGSVTGTGDRVGGLVGYNYGNMTGCCSTSSVSTAGYCAGGLTGQNTGTITNSYSEGIVAGNSYIGGLAGANGEYYNLGIGVLLPGLISNSYSTCVVSGGSGVGNSSVGGLVGRNWGGTVSACFWDMQTSGQATSDGGTGLTTIQMTNIHTYLNAGWDWLGEIPNGTHEIWQMPEPGSYPILTIFSEYALPPLEGLGTLESPYLVSDAVELGAIYYNNLWSCYKLTKPIDLSGISWSMSVIPWFAGTFDGNNLTISHLTVNSDGEDYVGLFGQLVSGAEVKNLGVADANITGSGYCVGGIAGFNKGSLTQCSSTGYVSGTGDYVGGLAAINGGSITRCYSISTVDGNNMAGGLAGYNDGDVTQCRNNGAITGNQLVGGLAGGNGGSLSQCCNTGTVTCTGGYWDGYAGGLAGENNGDVTQCYNNGAITGNEHVGGLAGLNGGSLIKCYNTGTVTGTGWYWDGYIGGLVGENLYGSVSGCFWDIQTSGQTASNGGTGKTTTQMQTTNTFTNAGWDFTGETANGTNNFWSICEGMNYPRLAWQIRAGDYVCPDGIAMEDFAFFMDHWGDMNCRQDNAYCDGTDLDFSGMVNINDYEILVNIWLAENL